MSPRSELCTVKGTSVRLAKFEGQYQAQATWCWAAAAASIRRYYTKINAEHDCGSRQCFYVHFAFGRKACRSGLHFTPRQENEPDCDNRGCSTEAGDESARLDLALMGIKDAPLGSPSRDFTQYYEKSIPRPVSFQQIVDEIDHGDPMAIRIERAGDIFHLVVIIGYDSAVPALIIWDPTFGERLISYNQVQLRLGTWTHTIWTSSWFENAVTKYVQNQNVHPDTIEGH